MQLPVEILGFGRPVAWLPWAVQYFFLIGLSVASFLLSLPGLVWRRPHWQGLAYRALLAALVSGLSAPVALLADLHQPGRFLNFYLHPAASSWMAWGAFFIPLYLGGLLAYAVLALRPQWQRLGQGNGRGAALCRLLARGGDESGHQSRIGLAVAAAVGVLGGSLVLLYTGMEVAVVQARPLWHTPFLPILFTLSALSGGLGWVGLFEWLAGARASAPLLNRWQVRCQSLILACLFIWLGLAWSGLAEGPAEALRAMRLGAGWIWLGGGVLASSGLLLWLAHRYPQALIVPAGLALGCAWLLRWAVFIGGQSLPKMGATVEPYRASLTPDSLLGMLGTAGLCLVIYLFLTGFMDWEQPHAAHGAQS